MDGRENSFYYNFEASDVGVGAGGEEQKASLISVFQLLWLALVVAILFVGTFHLWYFH